MFDRVISLIGEDKFNFIKEKNVLIVGLGGVGGYALETLVRSGIHKFIIIDYDTIDISNLNRQIISDTSNVSKYKTDEFVKRIKLINPCCEVISHNIKLGCDNVDVLDQYKIDFIVDACDTVKTKQLLIDYAIEKDIKIISSMGTANKLDPTKLEIIEIRKTSYDPLAKVMRKYVVDKKINKKIMVVSSTEVVVKNKELASMMFVPASAGILCANYVISEILNEKSF